MFQLVGYREIWKTWWPTEYDKKTQKFIEYTKTVLVRVNVFVYCAIWMRVCLRVFFFCWRYGIHHTLYSRTHGLYSYGCISVFSCVYASHEHAVSWTTNKKNNTQAEDRWNDGKERENIYLGLGLGFAIWKLTVPIAIRELMCVWHLSICHLTVNSCPIGFLDGTKSTRWKHHLVKRKR